MQVSSFNSAQNFTTFNGGKYKVYNTDLCDPLGIGQYGAAYKLFSINDESKEPKMVLKRVKKKESMQIYEKEELTILELLHRVDAKHVLFSIDNFEDETYTYVVTPYCNKGNLDIYLLQKSLLSESVARKFMTDIVDGIYYIHSNGIIHRDLKPDNILLHKQAKHSIELFIADFGLSKLKDVGQTEKIGTKITMAPEVIHTNSIPYNNKADIYSIGTILFKMVTGKFPYDDYASVMSIGTKNIVISQSYNASLACLSFIELCVQINPEDRPSADELKNHPFIKDQIPYYLKAGLTYQEGDIQISHHNKSITNSMKEKINAMQKDDEKEAIIIHALAITK